MIVRKLMVLGEIGVGKTSLTRRLVTNRFEADYTPTIGVDVYRYVLPEGAAPQPVTLAIWDTDGNFGDAIFDHVYIKEASGALIVGDISRPASLETMTRLGRGFLGARPGRYLAYVVNKVDLETPDEPVTLPAGLSQTSVPLVKASALTGENVQVLFHDAACTMLRRGQ